MTQNTKKNATPPKAESTEQASEGPGVFPDGLPFWWQRKADGKLVAVRPPMFAGKEVVLVDPKKPGTKEKPGVYKYA